MSDEVTMVACIANSTSAIKFEGEQGAGGRVTFEVDGSQVAELAALLLKRGKRLIIIVKEVVA